MTPAPAHRIRLRGFWEAAPLPDGRTRHRRPFGQPRSLAPGERAWLVCDGVPGPAAVAVNGVPVGAVVEAGPFAFDVTEVLRPRNEAAVEVAATGGLGEVALEIRAG